MKFIYRLLAMVLCLCSRPAYAQMESIDTGISHVADILGAQIKESGRKKITVLDFSDLQGRTTELGRFLAEELSIALVERRAGFAVMDRANLKKILEELKLTADGLVDPENAKKLGQFAGVDAIVIGNMTPLPDEVALTVKIIATDTAEIMGAAKARLQKGKEVVSLLEIGVRVGADTAAKTVEKSKAPEPNLITQNFGNLSIVLEGLRALDNQTILISLIFQNRGERAIAVAAYCESTFGSEAPLRSSLLGSDGIQFMCNSTDLSGIRGLRSRPSNLTEIPPGEEIRTSFKYRSQQHFSMVPPSLRLQAEIVMNANYSAAAYPANYQAQQDQLPGGCSIHNLVLDIPVRK